MFIEAIGYNMSATIALFAKLRKRKESEKEYFFFYVFYAAIIR